MSSTKHLFVMQIDEFPGLQVDDFRIRETQPQLSLCLLTHMHSDHLSGLERLSYHSPPVYCSAATRAMVLNLRHNNGDGPLKYHHLRKEGGGIEILQALDVGIPHQLTCQSRTVQVTLIPTVHCPGATMFLVDDGNTAILFTGDIRCEAWHVNALSHHPALLPFTLGQAISLYVDNTFEQHDNPDQHYDENSVGVAELLATIDSDNTKYPDNIHFALVASSTGYEEALIALALRFQTKIHLDSYYYHCYMAAADTCPLARQIIGLSTINPASARVHWCRKGHCENRDGPLTIYLSPRVTMSQSDIDERNRKLDIRDFPGGTYNEQTLFVHTESAIRYVLSQDGHTLLPGHIYFKFSRHASLPELVHFKAMFPACTVKSLAGEPIPQLDPDAVVQLKIYRKKAWSTPVTAVKRKMSVHSSTESNGDILDFLHQQAQESSLSTPPASPRKDSVRTAEPSIESTSNESKVLEETLRNNLDEWFNLKFDWKNSPIYGYK